MDQLVECIPELGCIPAAGAADAELVSIRLASEEMAMCLFAVQRLVETGAKPPRDGVVAAFLQLVASSCEKSKLLVRTGTDLTMTAYVPPVPTSTGFPAGGSEDIVHKCKNMGQQTQAQESITAAVDDTIGEQQAAAGDQQPGSSSSRSELEADAKRHLVSLKALRWVVQQHKDEVSSTGAPIGRHLEFLLCRTDKQRHAHIMDLITDWELHELVYRAGFRNCATALRAFGHAYLAYDRRCISGPVRLRLLHDLAVLSTHLLSSYSLSIPAKVRGLRCQLSKSCEMLSMQVSLRNSYVLHCPQDGTLL